VDQGGCARRDAPNGAGEADMNRAALAVSAALVALLASQARAAEEGARRKRRPTPPEYGRVVIANHSEEQRLAPAVFDHWLHRAKYTCRVCHVDIGFAMKAGGTDIRAADNMAGHYCGACHGRVQTPEGKRVFPACQKANPAPGAAAPCLRCHSLGKGEKREYDFATFTTSFPKERFGNGIDWERAEHEKLIKPVDVVEGVSVPRRALPATKDFALPAKLQGMPSIIFSHAKHTVWNGCELCHPDLFAVRASGTKTSMVQIFEGGSCGACHTSVAFPHIDCPRCHTTRVK
jgi:c(7)-type cytochrome triheme protein